ncbi:hypothetical protein FSP39_006805 [Pinctada imbricata]|uniref:C-type lectin domain-containing protein n=1 Tax=Pinctada imbricata TaxID=66713 RepID=A0AA88XJU0_PINIB|nr:hypothetical protein FSP39_006805 [Pinctada imbricata]
MSDEVTEGVFLWSESGNIHPYSVSPWKELWVANQPDNSNLQQHCVMIRYTSSGYAFDDFKCTGNNKKHICQCDAA